MDLRGLHVNLLLNLNPHRLISNIHNLSLEIDPLTQLGYLIFTVSLSLLINGNNNHNNNTDPNERTSIGYCTL